MTGGGSTADRWTQWLGHRRFAGDPEAKARMFSELLVPIREQVLDGAEPVEDQRVLDVGCGDGLIAFGAVDRGAAKIVFSDISADLLAESHRLARARGVLERCAFVKASADDLWPIESGSIDIVTTRSVLIYVRDKAACFAEFCRVLRSGGRLSIFEPVTRFGQREWTGSRLFGVDMRPVAATAAKIHEVYSQLMPADDPMLDFDERDLVGLAESAGFEAIDLTLKAEVRPAEPCRWEVFLNGAGNPNLPTPAEFMAQSLTPEERDELTAYLRPLVETGQRTRRIAHAFLRCVQA
jgi:ubiquinone/menaquinone biosynthesis C-methylase UbiE